MSSKKVTFDWNGPDGSRYECTADVEHDPGIAPSLSEPGEPSFTSVEVMKVNCPCGMPIPYELWEPFEKAIKEKAIEAFEED